MMVAAGWLGFPSPLPLRLNDSHWPRAWHLFPFAACRWVASLRCNLTQEPEFITRINPQS